MFPWCGGIMWCVACTQAWSSIHAFKLVTQVHPLMHMTTCSYLHSSTQLYALIHAGICSDPCRQEFVAHEFKQSFLQISSCKPGTNRCRHVYYSQNTYPSRRRMTVHRLENWSMHRPSTEVPVHQRSRRVPRRPLQTELLCCSSLACPLQL